VAVALAKAAQKEAIMDELKKLRQRVARERAAGCGKDGKRYSEALRRDVSAYLQAARAKGTSPNQLAPALGLSVPTAYEWSSKTGGARRKSKAFQRMSVVSQAATADANAIVVTGPGGLRAVGLGVAELAELLRRLGC
jgi:hypothetical protein